MRHGGGHTCSHEGCTNHAKKGDVCIMNFGFQKLMLRAGLWFVRRVTIIRCTCWKSKMIICSVAERNVLRSKWGKKAPTDAQSTKATTTATSFVSKDAPTDSAIGPTRSVRDLIHANIWDAPTKASTDWTSVLYMLQRMVLQRLGL